MAIRSSLTLTEDQIRRMIQYVRARVQSIESERVQWVQERKRYEQEWNDDFSHRVSESNVFSKNNDSLNMVGSGADWLRARLYREIFGTRPYFSAEPVNPSGPDSLKADAAQKHLEWKLDAGQIDFPAAARQLITKAIKLGEGVAKVSYVEKKEEYERIASILCDTQGQPVVNSSGAFIHEDNGTEVISLLPEGVEPIRGRAEAIVVPAGNPDFILGQRINGEIVINRDYEWREQIVSEEAISYSGAKAFPLHFEEFYCPLNIPDVQEADFVAHMTQMRLSDLRSQFGIYDDREPSDSASGADAHIRRAIARIKDESAKPKAAGSKPRQGEGEGISTQDEDPVFRLLECYFEFDARQTGRTQRIYLTVAYDHDIAIFWDYIRNVTPKGLYPFEATRILAEDGRWYGCSLFKKYGPFQILIDRLFNQFVYRNDLASNPLKFRRKEAVKQWEDDQPFEIGPDRVFDLNEGFSAKDALGTVEVPQLDAQTRYLFETALASWRTRSGISAVTQGEAGGMPAEKTARGVDYIAESGNTMLNANIIEVKPGLEATLGQLAAYQYRFQSADEVFLYTEGEESVLLEMKLEHARNLELDITLTLTNARQTERLAKNNQAIAIFERFTGLPPQYKRVAGGLYADTIKNIGIDNPEQYIDGVIEADATLQQQQQAIAANEQAGPGNGIGGEDPALYGGLEGGPGLPQQQSANPL